MSRITIEKPSPERRKQLQIPEVLQASGPWVVWECEPSEFDWHYPQTEVAFVFEGRVKVISGSEQVEIKKGDLVTFPKGMDCKWQVIETIKKVYKFE